MKKELNGAEIAEYIKERQAKTARGLAQHWRIPPRLAIIRTNPAPVVDSYMKIKKDYGADIGVVVDVHSIDQAEAIALIQKLNSDDLVHGIIVQIPLPDSSQTTDILDAVKPEKDVDGLAEISDFDAPTPIAISWLLAGYNIELRGKKIVIVGQGRLVGRPLAKMWSDVYNVTRIDKDTPDIPTITRSADVIISATGVPGRIRVDMIQDGAIIVDAGVSTDSNGLVGDVEQAVRDLPGVTITPHKGGVGPLTVAALFENVLTAARKKSTISQ